ncbi:MAG TPA: glycosyltransferase [Candidatus Hydrogenedentes bacterium]|nr:glycosyltransferase [Candidatus Hydrogenedentota bacterium]HOK90651.1 glycosyltransferase [Candidatus Hydrogenedentota bacterium]
MSGQQQMESGHERVYLSVVAPVFNEQDTLEELYARLVRALEGTGHPFEVIFVDDGSTDGSLALLRNLRAKDRRIRVLRLARNFGQSAALYAGLAAARGSMMFIIDADLQVHPEDLPLLLERLEAGADSVSGRRRDRQDSLFRRWASRALNWYIGRAIGAPLHDFGCSLKGFRRHVVDAMIAMPHRCRYLPAEMALAGGRIEEVWVNHSERARGQSKYGLLKLVRTAFDLITGLTDAPLRLVSVGGVLFSLAGFLMFLRVLWVRLTHGNVLQVESVIALFFLFSGVQLLAIGLLCAYIGRIFIEVQSKPLYIVREELE